MLRRVGLVGLLLVVLATVPAGAPVQLSYVYSDSMEPALGVNDGYVLVPADDVEAGDIITFRSDERDTYVTHRVVEETTEGFVTKGDNNPTSDQKSGASPVTHEQIRGEVLTVGDDPFVIPALGAGIILLRANRLVLAALVVGTLAYSLVTEPTNRPRRELSRVRELVVPLFLFAALASIGVLAYGGTSHELTYVAVDANLSGSSTVAVGTSKPVAFAVNTSGNPLTTPVVDADGLNVTAVERTPTNLTVSGAIPPPRDIGPVSATVRVAQYPSVLPASVLQRLVDWNPLAAATVTVSAVFAPLWLLYVLVVDGAEPIRPSHSRLWRILTGRFE